MAAAAAAAELLCDRMLMAGSPDCGRARVDDGVRRGEGMKQ